MKKAFLGVALVVVACSGTSGGGDGGAAFQPPSLVGAYAFDAGRVSASTQTGNGYTAGDNLSLFIDEGCVGFGDRSINVTLLTRDHSALTATAYTVLPPNSAGNIVANLNYRDSRTNEALDAKSGTFTLDALDLALIDNRGSFSVQLGLPDGGSSTLSGTFDGRYLCH